jgi:type IX secretion system PorP/SprF family membrane protein
MKFATGLLLVVLISIGFRSYAQQAELFSQYMYNNLVYNPAIAGTKLYTPVMLDVREQWIGLNGRPRTQTASFHTPINRNHMGLGMFVSHDRVGPVERSSLSFAYAYNIKLSRKAKLSFGMNLAAYKFRLRTDDLVFDEELSPDNTLYNGTTSSLVPYAGAGLYYFNKKFYAGVSVPQLTTMETESGKFYVIDPLRHYYFNTGGTMKLNSIICTC